MVFAVALAPDGKTAAVGGWLTIGQDKYAVDLFDVGTGQLMRQFKVDEKVASLAFSQDGARLSWTPDLGPLAKV